MIYIIYGLILLNILIILYFWYYKRNINKKFKNEIIEKLDNELKEEKERIINNANEKRDIIINTLEEELIKEEKKYFNAIKTKELLTESIYRESEELMAHKKEIIDNEVKSYYDLEREKIKNKIDNETSNYRKEEEQKLTSFILECENAKKEFEKEKNEIYNELEDFRRRRAVINEAIRLEQMKENEFESHHLLLKETEKEDIQFLLSIKDKITNKELLMKLIWSEFIQRPFNEMIKRQFGANIPKNVIYCIEDSNGKKYIGKTKANIKDRWTAHLKSSLSIGTISHQSIHDAIFNNWWNFSFSVYEVVDENKNLGERESYWIKMFETDKVGYNMKG